MPEATGLNKGLTGLWEFVVILALLGGKVRSRFLIDSSISRSLLSSGQYTSLSLTILIVH